MISAERWSHIVSARITFSRDEEVKVGILDNDSNFQRSKK